MTPRITSFQSQGLIFDVLDQGPLDGEIVLLLHGFPERATSWQRVSSSLNAKGYRTIAPDQRGYSPGARPSRRRDYAVHHLVNDVAALTTQIGGPIHVAAHDWGSVVGWNFVGLHPARARSFTALAVPHPDAYFKALRRREQLLRSSYIGYFQLPKLPERGARLPGGKMDRNLLRAGMNEEDLATFRREIVDYGALPGALGWYRALPFSPRKHPRITVPTTLVWSDRDTAIARLGVDLTTNYVDAPYELVVLDGVTHWMLTQAPGRVTHAILERIRKS